MLLNPFFNLTKFRRNFAKYHKPVLYTRVHYKTKLTREGGGWGSNPEVKKKIVNNKETITLVRIKTTPF